MCVFVGVFVCLPCFLHHVFLEAVASTISNKCVERGSGGRDEPKSVWFLIPFIPYAYPPQYSDFIISGKPLADFKGDPDKQNAYVVYGNSTMPVAFSSSKSYFLDPGVVRATMARNPALDRQFSVKEHGIVFARTEQ